MRPIGLGFAAALFVAVLAPLAVMSAPKAPPPTVSPEARKIGMAEAPAIVQAAGLPCKVADARLVGKVAEDKKTNKPAQSFYEVACGEGTMGYIVQSSLGAPASAFSCIEADFPADGSKPNAPCMLPGNADPKAVLGPMLQKAGVTCVPESTRGIGQTKTNTYLEVACQGSVGYVVVASAPFDTAKPAQAQNCLSFDDGQSNIKCTLQPAATRLAILDKYAADSKTNCAVKDRRYVGAATDGTSYFEASCQDGKGYIFKIAANGSVAQSYECAKATNILGGCTLTDARQAATEQASLYTKLAKAAGSSCVVEKYAVFPARGSDEVVELVCTGGASAIGIFPGTGKGQVLDCGHALVAGYKCSIGKVDYADLTADLRKFDQKSCVVSNARPAAKTAKGTILIEVACSDGLKGYMIEFNPSPVTAIAAPSCAFSGGCKLPGNT